MFSRFGCFLFTQGGSKAAGKHLNVIRNWLHTHTSVLYIVCTLYSRRRIMQCDMENCVSATDCCCLWKNYFYWKMCVYVIEWFVVGVFYIHRNLTLAQGNVYLLRICSLMRVLQRNWTENRIFFWKSSELGNIEWHCMTINSLFIRWIRLKMCTWTCSSHGNIHGDWWNHFWRRKNCLSTRRTSNRQIDKADSIEVECDDGE